LINGVHYKTINKKTTFDFSDPNKEYVVMNIPDELSYMFDAGTKLAICASANGELMVITNNPEAKDATLEEIYEFLREDNTDSIPYIKGTFECGEYARIVHDNAERLGLRAGVTPIIKRCPRGHYTNHMWNVFKPSDVEGLLFIDCSSSPSYIEDGNWYGDTAILYDKENRTYTRASLYRDGKPFDKIEHSEFKIVSIDINW